jgi:hypothetical protein
MALVFAYGTGTLNTLISFTLDHKNLLRGSAINEYWLSFTLGIALASAGFLHLIGRMDANGYLFHNIDFDQFKFNHQKLVWFIAVVALLTIIFLGTGRLGFMASVAAVQGYASVSVSSTIVLAFITPVGALATYFAFVEKSRYRILFIFTSLLMLFVQFGLGRRIFVFSLFMYVMAALMVYRPKRMLTVKNIIALGMLVITVQVATTAFYAMRLARWNMTATVEAPTIIEIIPEAIKVYQNRERNFMMEKMKENTGSRSFILEYLATLTQQASKIEPLYGKDFVRALVIATPSILYPSKYKNPLFAAEEVLVNPYFRLPVWDASNSLLTAGISDFGVAGCFIIPVFICVLFSLFLRFIFNKVSPVAYLLVAVSVGQVLLSVEADLVSYLSSMRTFGIILIISWLVFGSKKTSLISAVKSRKKSFV